MQMLKWMKTVWDLGLPQQTFVCLCISRLIMLEKVRQFIPNILNLSKRRPFEILVNGSDIDNDDLVKYNNKDHECNPDFYI